MTARDVACYVFLALAVLVVLASAVGILVMPDAARKLHFVTPAALVAPVLVAVAVLIAGGLDYGTGLSFLTLAFLIFAGPFLSHATIRAIRVRETRDGKQPSPTAGGRR